MTFSTGSPPGCVNFDFERGNLYGWKKSGTAFDFQPTYGDNPKARRSQPARQQGRWWIGTYEKRPNPRVRAGSIQGDRPTGTLTSLRFKIVGPYINFLIGGGCNINYNRVELVINGRGVVRRSKGKSNELKATNIQFYSISKMLDIVPLKITGDVDSSKGLFTCSWGTSGG